MSQPAARFAPVISYLEFVSYGTWAYRGVTAIGAAGGQSYDWTTRREGMNYLCSTELGPGKALLKELPWQRFESHPEWVAKENFAAGIPGELRVIHIPKRGIYEWDGMAPVWCNFVSAPPGTRRASVSMGRSTIWSYGKLQRSRT